MKLKLALFACVLSIAGAAQSAPIYQGPITVVDPEFAIFNKGGLVGPFDLYWDFTLSGGMFSATSSVTSFVNGTKDVDFTSIFLTDGTNTYNYALTSADPSEQWSLAPVTLQSNVTYEIHTIGSATGRAAFAGELQLTPINVPEPGTLALALAGLGALGVVARRRQQRASC